MQTGIQPVYTLQVLVSNVVVGPQIIRKYYVEKNLKPKEEGSPRVYEISSIIEYIEVATWLYSDDNVIFRGQTKEKNYPLIPSVGRDVDRSRIPWREQEILEEFKRESIPYIDFIPVNDWQWLALAQHNRLPTRLLDWTKNPLAALWFAVKDTAIDNEAGVVWAFHYEASEAIFNTAHREHPFNIDKTYVYFPEHVFPFIQAQSGVFTVHHQDGNNPIRFPSIEQTENSDLLLTKIEIPSQYFSTVRYHLFRIGISPASLFPGLSGLVEKIIYDNKMCSDEGKSKQNSTDKK